MKKLLPLILTTLLLLSACTPAAGNIQAPVNFYYPRETFDYDAPDGVIASEVRESADCADENEILQRYFRGPEDPMFQRPFPAATELVSLQLQENVATIILTDNISTLTGMDLTLACACIAKTAIDILNVEQVTIQAQTQSLGGQTSITLTLEDLLLLDSSKIVIEPD